MLSKGLERSSDSVLVRQEDIMVPKPVKLSVELENSFDISIQGRKGWANMKESDRTNESQFKVINENKDACFQEIHSQNMEKKSKKTSLLEMISSNILRYVHPTRLLWLVCATLMVPIMAFKDREDVDEVLAIDSGMGSNISNNNGNNIIEPVLHEPGLELDVVVDSPPGIVESNPEAIFPPPTLPEDPEKVSPPHFQQLITDPVSNQSLWHQVTEDGDDEVVSISRNLAEYSRYLYGTSPVPMYGVRPGSKQQLLSFVSFLGRAVLDTGIFLTEFVPPYNINKGVDRFQLGKEYRRLREFSAGREVYLCQAVATGYLFVTKMVPLEDVPMPGNSGQTMKRLRYPQQVELVLGLQDSVPWVAKIHGVIKRIYRGTLHGEVFIEYCAGGTFKDNLLTLRSLTLMAKWRLTKNILDIVGQLHQQTIIHGDLKPDNICFRRNGAVLIDFESGKHPLYKPNRRATCLYLPPWIRDLARSDFNLLKTMDLWAIGMILLDIVFVRSLWQQEYNHLLVCNTCDASDGRCQHVQRKLMHLLHETYPRGLTPYLPVVDPDDDPLLKSLALLIRGLLSTCGPRGQLSVEDAQDAMLDDNILVQILKNGEASIPPLIVKHGTTVKNFMKHGQLQQLKSICPDLGAGMWFTFEKRRQDGRVKEYSLMKNHSFTESCVLHVYPPI